MSQNIHEAGILIPERFVKAPWLVYSEVPRFEDKWKELTDGLPDNMQYVYQRGSLAYWETFVTESPEAKMQRVDYMFAPQGVQPEEEEFAEAFARATELTKIKHHILHVRHDLESKVPETHMNADIRNIVGHSEHKIPKNELILADGEWWHQRDYYEAHVWELLEQET